MPCRVRQIREDKLTARVGITYAERSRPPCPPAPRATTDSLTRVALENPRVGQAATRRQSRRLDADAKRESVANKRYKSPSVSEASKSGRREAKGGGAWECAFGARSANYVRHPRINQLSNRRACLYDMRADTCRANSGKAAMSEALTEAVEDKATATKRTRAECQPRSTCLKSHLWCGGGAHTREAGMRTSGAERWERVARNRRASGAAGLAVMRC
jgi:hypothetical protein